MSFQWIFDNAETLSLNCRPIVSQTRARNQKLRSISRGGAVWRFTVKMPDGKRWSEVRQLIDYIDQSNLLSNQAVNLSKAAYNHIVGYQGAVINPEIMTFRYTASQAASNTMQFELGNLQNLQTTGPNIGPVQTVPANTVLFRPGDFIQSVTGGNSVYTVSDTVLRGTTNTQIIRVNRSILSTPSELHVAIRVGSNVTWTLMCTACPQWTLISRDIVGWSDEFQFQEYIL